MKYLLIAAAAAALIPAAAQAQTEAGTGLYAGAQLGYHDYQGGFDNTFVGGYVGFNAPAGETLVVGVEGNYNYGIDGDVDHEYGVSGHLGFRTGTGLLFGRVGYQWASLDIPEALEDVVDDTDGGVLYGVGGEFGMGERSAFRVTLDTIEFDTVRAAVGLTFHF